MALNSEMHRKKTTLKSLNFLLKCANEIETISMLPTYFIYANYIQIRPKVKSWKKSKIIMEANQSWLQVEVIIDEA